MAARNLARDGAPQAAHSGQRVMLRPKHAVRVVSAIAVPHHLVRGTAL